MKTVRASRCRDFGNLGANLRAVRYEKEESSIKACWECGQSARVFLFEWHCVKRKD